MTTIVLVLLFVIALAAMSPGILYINFCAEACTTFCAYSKDIYRRLMRIGGEDDPCYHMQEEADCALRLVESIPEGILYNSTTVDTISTFNVRVLFTFESSSV